MKPERQGRYLTTGQVAKACEVSLVAVKKWIARGKLRALRTPGGHYRIAVDEFQRFQSTYRFAADPEEASRVLVVDDDPGIVRFVVRALGDIHPALKLEAAANGYEGLLKVGTFRPHLLLLDLRMPGLDGFEVCRRIKSDPATQGTKILAISALPEATAREKILESGADGFLPKPFTFKELEAHVIRLVELDRRRVEREP